MPSEEVSGIKKAAGEYASWALKARREYYRLRLRQDPAIRKLYRNAIKKIADLLRSGRASGIFSRNASGLLKERSYRWLLANLEDEANALGVKLDLYLAEWLADSVRYGSAYSYNISLKLFEAADWPKSISRTGIEKLFGQVNRDAVEAIYARSKDGLFLSDRIWQKGQLIREPITDIIQTSVAIGQDAVETARALEQYVERGAKTLTKNYPNMMKRMQGRIPSDLSYEALRLARTETTSAFGEGTILGASANPFYNGIQWVLSASHPEPDICDDLASHVTDGMPPGVYPPGQEPRYPAHPNELCALVPIMEASDSALQEILNWVDDPKSSDKIETWYQKTYLSNAL